MGKAHEIIGTRRSFGFAQLPPRRQRDLDKKPNKIRQSRTKSDKVGQPKKIQPSYTLSCSRDGSAHRCLEPSPHGIIVHQLGVFLAKQDEYSHKFLVQVINKPEFSDFKPLYMIDTAINKNEHCCN